MINVTLTFSGLPELLKFFASVDAPATGIKVETTTGGPAPKPVKAQSAAPAAPAPVAAPAPITAAPEAAPALDAAPAVDYPTLQKAVFALAGKSREAAAAIAAQFGVKTFKELPESAWAGALEAVTERLAIVEAN